MEAATYGFQQSESYQKGEFTGPSNLQLATWTIECLLSGSVSQPIFIEVGKDFSAFLDTSPTFQTLQYGPCFVRSPQKALGIPEHSIDVQLPSVYDFPDMFRGFPITPVLEKDFCMDTMLSVAICPSNVSS